MNRFLTEYYNSYSKYLFTKDNRNTCDYREVIKYIPDFLITFIKSSPLCVDNYLFLFIDNQTVTYTYDKQNMKFKCSPIKSAIIFIPIVISFPHSTIKHGNSIIIDTRRKEIEHFEPHGSSAVWWPSINRFLYDLFSNLYPNYNYISTNDFCPIGPQLISQDAYCAAWNVLYMKTRIDYPLINRNHIISYLTSLSKENLNHLISAFICFLHFYGLKTHLLPALDFYYQLLNQYGDKIYDDEFILNLLLLAEQFRQTNKYHALLSLKFKFEI